MKIEICTKRPENFKVEWPGQYQMFSHMEYACGIPQLLFAITTLKKNGKPNLNLHSWSCFQGDGEGFFAILAGMMQNSHTYENIQRTEEFCVNFLSPEYYESLKKAIEYNEEKEEEFSLSDLTIEPSTYITVPRIKESFLSLECKCESISDLSRGGISALVIGRVLNIAAEEEFAKGYDDKYTEKGFMFNIHAPKNLVTGQDDVTGIATLKIKKTF